MAHYKPPHQDLRCLQIQLFSSLVLKELVIVVVVVAVNMLNSAVMSEKKALNDVYRQKKCVLL